MNVLVVMPLGEFGGGSERMLYTYLTSRSDNILIRLHFVFLSDGGLADEARQHGYPVEVVNAGRLRDFGRWVRVQLRITHLLDIWSIDRVLAWMPKAGAYVALPARLKGISLYMWRHDIPHNLDRIDRLVLQVGRPSGVACSSEIARQAFSSISARIPTKTIYPAATPLDIDDRKSMQIRASILNGAEGPVVGTIARLQPWKRIDLFLSACSLLKETYPQLRVVVVGGESHGLSQGYSEELKRIGYALLGDSVVFTGEQKDVGNWLQSMDLFVLASEGEPFGIVLLEALAAGKPVIGCAGGGPEEIIDDDVVGTVLPRNPTPQQMARAMKTYLEPSKKDEAKQRNSNRINSFSPTGMAGLIDEWLGQAL